MMDPHWTLFTWSGSSTYKDELSVLHEWPPNTNMCNQKQKFPGKPVINTVLSSQIH